MPRSTGPDVEAVKKHRNSLAELVEVRLHQGFDRFRRRMTPLLGSS